MKIIGEVRNNKIEWLYNLVRNPHGSIVFLYLYHINLYTQST